MKQRLFTYAWLALGCAVSVASAADVSMRLVTGGAGWLATGNRLFSTASAGLEWKDITPPGTVALHGVFFADAAQGWALGSTGSGLALARTSDGGHSWSTAAFPLSAQDAARYAESAGIHFVDAQNGWIMLRRMSNSNFSFGMLFATSDGGATWSKLPELPVGDAPRFVSKTDGWLAGGPAGDKLFVTRDGGRSWWQQRVAPAAGISDQAAVRYSVPRFESERNGVMAATYTWEGNTAWALYETNDGGTTWHTRTVSAGSGSENRPVFAIADSRLISVTSDQAGLLTTSVDEFSSIADRQISSEASVLSADFADTRQGWVLTQEGHCLADKSSCTQEERLLATSDSGRTFQDITPTLMRAAVAGDAGEVPESVVIASGKGFDNCGPSISGLSAWKKSSPYKYVGVYIGGDNAGCPQPGLSKSWVTSVVGQGWGLIPTWVGPQAPCTGCSSCGTMSSNPSTAASEGASNASSAASKMASIGLKGSVIYYDMEAYSTGNASCSAATKAFINAWVQKLKALGYHAGVYGSPSNANDDWKNLSNKPEDVWIALWNGSASVKNLSPLPNSVWANHQRLHQYLGNRSQTYGGVHYNVDEDFLDGPVAK